MNEQPTTEQPTEQPQSEHIIWAQIICPLPLDALAKLCKVAPPGARLRPGNQTFHEGAFHDVVEVVADRKAAANHNPTDVMQEQPPKPDPKDALIELRNAEVLQLRKQLQEEQLQKRHVLRELASAERRKKEQADYIALLESQPVKQQPAARGVRGWVKQLLGVKQ